MIKKQEIIELYSKLLAPLGYNVVPQAKPYEEPETDKAILDKYGKLSSAELEKELFDLKAKSKQLESEMHSIRLKAVDFLNKEGPNPLTARFYTGTISAKAAINKSFVRVDSTELKDTLSLISNLEKLQKAIIIRELTEKLQTEIPVVQKVAVDTVGSTTVLILNV